MHVFLFGWVLLCFYCLLGSQISFGAFFASSQDGPSDVYRSSEACRESGSFFCLGGGGWEQGKKGCFVRKKHEELRWMIYINIYTFIYMYAYIFIYAYMHIYIYICVFDFAVGKGHGCIC